MPDFFGPAGLKLLFVACLAVAMAWDVATLEIPDWVSAALTFGAVGALIFHRPEIAVLAVHLAAGLVAFGVGAALFAARVWGGGDVKLMAAVAVWTGFEVLLSYVLAVAVVGGLVGLVLLVFRRLPLSGLVGQAWLRRLHDPQEGVPYGIALGVAGLLLADRIIANIAGTT